MTFVRSLAVALVLLPAQSALRAQAPTPPAETKKLEVFVCAWKYDGDAKASPMGPATKISGTQTGRMVMNGFFLEWKGEEKGIFGGVQWGEMDWYDAATKTYPFTGWQNDGTVWSGANTVVGNTWKSTSTLTVKGVTYHQRGEWTVTADGKSETWKVDVSKDGKTWAPWNQGKMVKTP